MTVVLSVNLDDDLDKRLREAIIKKYDGVPRKGAITFTVIEALEDWIKKNK